MSISSARPMMRVVSVVAGMVVDGVVDSVGVTASLTFVEVAAPMLAVDMVGVAVFALSSAMASSVLVCN